MKRPLTYLLLLFLPMLLHAQENAYLDAIRIDNYQLQKNGKEVQLEMTLLFDQLELSSQHALRIVPVLTSADGNHHLPLEAIQLYGTQRQKVQQRANVLNGTPLAAPGDRLTPIAPRAAQPLWTIASPFPTSAGW